MVVVKMMMMMMVMIATMAVTALAVLKQNAIVTALESLINVKCTHSQNW